LRLLSVNPFILTASGQRQYRDYQDHFAHNAFLRMLKAAILTSMDPSGVPQNGLKTTRMMVAASV
jgi:hypothetical protein